jgi:hypothetical protein
MMDDAIAPLLIDTATLLRLQLHRWTHGPDNDDRTSSIIESLVLFDRIILDAPSIAYNQYDLDWTAELSEGVELATLDEAQNAALDRRVAGMFESLAGAEPFVGGERRDMLDLLPVNELGGDEMPSFPWWAVLREIHRYPDAGPVLSEIQNRAVDNFRHDRPRGSYNERELTLIATLIRLFHYLTLQEMFGAHLLLDRQKSLVRDVPRYGYTASILENFETEVRAKYEERRRRWLGESAPGLPVPALSRYITTVAETRGWSLGRAVTWLRDQPQVKSYRSGMAELVRRLQAGDAAGADEIFVDLDEAAARWAVQLGAKPERRRLPVTIALPIVETALPLPLPKFRRTPAEKLLILIDVLMSTD